MINAHLFGTLAYIDPGAGAMLLQWVIAAVLGSGMMFRRTIARFFRRMLGRDKRKEENQEDPSSESAVAGSDDRESRDEADRISERKQ